jgi:predicted nuclease of predicted toxin-antitoxin system
VKLLLDEMWSASIAIELRERGHDVLAVLERPELRAQPARVIWAAAMEEDRVVVTENTRDFVRIARETWRAGRSHNGLIYTSVRAFPRGNQRTIGRLVRALERLLLSDDELTDREVWL